MRTGAELNQLSRTVIGGAIEIHRRVGPVTITTEHDRRQLQTYLELAACPLGLIINFGAKTLVDGVRRVVNDFPDDDPKV